MNRRTLLTRMMLASAALVLGPAACGRDGTAGDGRAGKEFPPVDIGREEWVKILDADRYRILFREGTEPAFSSPLDKQYAPGTYICAACFLPLFTHEQKFDSGTGWPSFTDHIEGHIDTKLDLKLIVPRTEYHCARCGGHQGHVFDDGPPPTGRRWCNNGLALKFVPESGELPALRASA